MKIAVTSCGTTPQDQVDVRFGRARYFMIYDTETKGWECKSNDQNLEAAQGAGIQAAQNIYNSGAEVLLTGNVGPKAFRVLSANNIKIYSASDMTVGEALTAYQQGKLSEMHGANVQGHW